MKCYPYFLDGNLLHELVRNFGYDQETKENFKQAKTARS
jgi:hypothetical protein